LFMSTRGDLHTPKYYSFYVEGLMIKLGKNGKVVFIDQEYIEEMKIYPLFRCILIKYCPEDQEYQTKINFIIRYMKNDKERMMKIMEKKYLK